MKKRLLSLTLIAALCLSLLPVTALAANGDTVYVGGVALSGSESTPVYATTDESGNVIKEGASADNYNIKWDGDTLTLHNATIKKGVSTETSTYVAGAAIGVLNQNGAAELTIQLEGDNTIAEVGKGIYVLARFTGGATLTITGDGSLDASASQTGIWVQSNSGNATLTIRNAKVEATGTSYGVNVQSCNSSTASLSVDGGSMTASGSPGILYDSSGSGIVPNTTALTISNSAIVDARGGGIGAGLLQDLKEVSPADDSVGIVFGHNRSDSKAGTVYGSVTLQKDLTIGEGESLTLAKNASLSAGGYNVIVDGGTLDDSIKTNLGDSVKYTPTITTESLPNGTVGETYNQTLSADGTTPITWSLAEGSSLPTNLTLNASTGEISGTPTTAETSTFTVTATNAYGFDSKQFTLTIEAVTDVSVESVSLDKTTLELTEGSTETLTATITPNNATNKTVTWESSDTRIATVDESGKVTAIAPGEATITVTTADGGKTATCTVTVHTATTITTQPQSVSVTEGQSATFSVAASGDNLRYQWQINSGNGWSDITGATDASYTIDRTTTAMSGNQYRCIVTGDGGETTSSAATLTVRPYAPPIHRQIQLRNCQRCG